MDIRILIGIVLGIAVCLVGFILKMKWRQGRKRRKGRRAEKEIAGELKRLKDREREVFNDVLLPSGSGRTAQIDHIVVCRRGIFVIETKSHAGRITGSEHSQYWTRHLSDSSQQLYNPLLQNKAHIRTLRKILSAKGVRVDESMFVSMVVFTEAWRLDVRAEEIVIPRKIFPDRHIMRTFLPSERQKGSWWHRRKEVRLDDRQELLRPDEIIEEIERRPRVLSNAEVEEIADIIEETALQGRKNVKNHAAYARQTARSVSREIRQGNCPRCGGRLVIKRGERGEFVGCENFPNCRFTCSIDRIQ